MKNPVLIENGTLESVANAIRAKTGKSEKMLPSEFANAISSIVIGGGVNLPDTVHTGTFTVAENTSEPQVITHGFSKAPNMVFYFAESDWTGGAATLGGVMPPSGTPRVLVNNSFAGYDSGFAPSKSATQLTLTTRNSTYNFKAGVTYRWIAVCVTI